MRVSPSGADFATEFAPTVPPAPARLSTTTGWPQAASSLLAISRPIESTGEPRGTD